MKIALINGSPKNSGSASECILQDLRVFLENDSSEIAEFCFKKPRLDEEVIEQLTEYDVLIFAFPLYVDGIPSHLLNCLIQLEQLFVTINRRKVMVYTLVNCGFYEGHQNRLAIEMMENWCAKAGLEWGQGVGVGAGGMLPTLKNVPVGHGPKKNLGKVLIQFANSVLKCKSEENTYITANFPRFAYKLAAEMGWRQSIKANGLKRTDLFLRK